MSLNKQSGNMYEFITDTWNPLIGECPHKCVYCSTNKLRKRYPLQKKRYSGDLRLDENCFKDNLKSRNFIFVCAQNDLFAEATNRNDIIRIFNYCKRFDNTYLFQTKNPKRFLQFREKDFPQKSILAVTLETPWVKNKISQSPDFFERVHYMKECRKKFDFERMITIEPIMDFYLELFIEQIKIINPYQINIGADSGKNNLPEPKSDKIDKLINIIKRLGITVVLKPNLKRLYAP